MVGVLKKLSVPAGIVINQYQEGQTIIDDYALKEDIPILARIPFDRQIAELYSTGIPFIEALDIYDDIFSGIIPQIEELLAK
jgi:MinD superfamily P-loop ATPase